MRFPDQGIHEDVHLGGPDSPIVGSVNLDEAGGAWYGKLPDGRRSGHTVRTKQEAVSWVLVRANGPIGVN